MAYDVRTPLLPVLDRVRVLMDQLNLRRYDVTLRIIQWSGSQIGDGTSTVTETPLVLGGPGGLGAGANHRPKVKLLSSQEVVASGGLYRAGDFKIGPLTPSYDASVNAYFGPGGLDPNFFDPNEQLQPTEIFFKLQGPGMQPDGSWFKKIDQNATRNLEYYFIIRADALQNP